MTVRKSLAKLSLALLMGGAAIGVASAPASATTASHNGFCGAFNMVQSSPTFNPNAVSDGMDIAMSRDAAQGNAGMFHAVDVSSCS